MKLLIIEQEVFIDPHGSADETSACNKFVSKNKNFLKLNGKYSQSQIKDSDFKYCINNNIKISDYLSEDNGFHDEEHELQASEDGYNSNYWYYSVRKITDKEYTLYKDFIDKYYKIK
jgi:hypothetical protein